ncbi:MAG: IclR family transcriptional regulator, partial [Actinobacteria bacterium]|nr:IclR family transcriptional regulator [Actinomycetota bacterium]
ELGSQVGLCRPDGLRSLAAPFVAELFRETAHAVHLAVLDGPDVLYIEKVHGHATPRVPTTIGGRMPASCTALGKAMLPFGHDDAARKILARGLARKTRRSVVAPGLFLSELRRIRESGVAYDREESALGLTCVAAPVRYRGTAIAAVSISGPTSRLDPEKAAARVLRTAGHISALYAKRQPDHHEAAIA